MNEKLINKIMILMVSIIISQSSFAWEKSYRIKAESSKIQKIKLFGEGCSFPNEIKKKSEGEFSIEGKDAQSSCTAIIKDELGKRAQLKCDKDKCEIIQSKARKGIVGFDLSKTNEDSYTLKDK